MYYSLYFLTPSFFPFGVPDRRTDGRTTFFTPCYQSSFFSLSTRGPTRMCNSTGLAKLWGGWPIEQDRPTSHVEVFGRLCIHTYSGTWRKFGESWQSPTQKNVPGSNLCRLVGGLSAKCADFWLLGRHVADTSATFPAKTII